jgi:sugar phosphate isomerase/epimerase
LVEVRPTKEAGMWTLSGFADEIADDFTTQCEVASELGLKFLEIRSAWGVNILKLDDAQLDTMKRTLASYGLLVSSIGSPIGKIFIDEPFEPHLVQMRELPRSPISSMHPSSGSSPSSSVLTAIPTIIETRCCAGCAPWPRSPRRRA